MDEYINNIDHVDNNVMSYTAWITCINIETVIKVCSITYWLKLEIKKAYLLIQRVSIYYRGRIE